MHDQERLRVLGGGAAGDLAGNYRLAPACREHIHHGAVLGDGGAELGNRAGLEIVEAHQPNPNCGSVGTGTQAGEENHLVNRLLLLGRVAMPREAHRLGGPAGRHREIALVHAVGHAVLVAVLQRPGVGRGCHVVTGGGGVALVQAGTPLAAVLAGGAVRRVQEHAHGRLGAARRLLQDARGKRRLPRAVEDE